MKELLDLMKWCKGFVFLLFVETKNSRRRPVRPIKASPHDRPKSRQIPSTRMALLEMARACLPKHMQFFNKTKLHKVPHIGRNLKADVRTLF